MNEDTGTPSRLDWSLLPGVIEGLTHIRSEAGINTTKGTQIHLAIEFLTYQLRTKTTQKEYHTKQNAQLKAIKAKLSSTELAKIDADARTKVNGGTTL